MSRSQHGSDTGWDNCDSKLREVPLILGVIEVARPIHCCPGVELDNSLQGGRPGHFPCAKPHLHVHQEGAHQEGAHRGGPHRGSEQFHSQDERVRAGSLCQAKLSNMDSRSSHWPYSLLKNTCRQAETPEGHGTGSVRATWASCLHRRVLMFPGSSLEILALSGQMPTGPPETYALLRFRAESQPVVPPRGPPMLN